VVSQNARAHAFLVAPDSFKGTFSAAEVAAAIARGLKSAGAEADLCPAADGGEGTMEVLLEALGGEQVAAMVHDPLGREVRASWGRLTDGRGIVELAQASGLGLVREAERDAELASSFGTGELIAAALAGGAQEVLVAAGGSATTDGGLGAVEAIRDAGGLGGATLMVLCDVRTRFEEAARTFGPQKGAGPDTVARLEDRLEQLAEQLPRDPRGVEMAGAAGGLAGGLWAAFGAELRSGAAAVLDAVGFDRRLSAADACVTGEGRLDSQSLSGKLVGEMAGRCRSARRPLHIIAGEIALDESAAAELGASAVAASTLDEIATAAAALPL
jgi:glycerate kinase